jgi:hypothetical protein
MKGPMSRFDLQFLRDGGIAVFDVPSDAPAIMMMRCCNGCGSIMTCPAF